MDPIKIFAAPIQVLVPFTAFVLILCSNGVNSVPFVEEMQCATLFSEENLEGDTFYMNHFDQSMNLIKDYRTSLFGWAITGSIRVEDNCALNICSQTYLQGDCKTLQAGIYEIGDLILPIRSSSCLCTRECKCQDITIPRNPVTCGRAYLQGGCNTCESKYIQLHCKGNVMLSSAKYKDVFESLIIRKGCKLTIYSEYRWKGTSQVFKDEITESYKGPIASYKIRCDDDAYLPNSSKDPYVLLNKEEFLSKLFNPNTPHLSIRPEASAPVVTLESRRSQKHAYILYLGASSPAALGFDCKDAKNKIGECRVPLEIDDLGFSNPQLRIIYTPIPQGGPENDPKIAASLDEYLLNHEELTSAIPNAVIIYYSNWTDATIAQKDSPFQRILSIANALRHQIFDENYSNIIFLLDKLGNLPSKERKNPEKKISEFEKAIEDKWPLPKPLVIVPGDTARLKINGYWKIQDEEYFPKNLQDELALLAEKSGDDLGRVVFKAAFPEECQRSAIFWNKFQELIAGNHPKIEAYKQSLASPVAAPVKTQLSVLSQKRQLKICCNVLFSMKMTTSENCELEEKFMEFQDQLAQVQKEADEKISEMKSDFLQQIEDLKGKLGESQATKVECPSNDKEIEDLRSQIENLNKKLAESQTQAPPMECEKSTGTEDELKEQIKLLELKLQEGQGQTSQTECGAGSGKEESLKEQIKDLNEKLEAETEARELWTNQGNEIPNISDIQKQFEVPKEGEEMSNQVEATKESETQTQPETQEHSEIANQSENQEQAETTNQAENQEESETPTQPENQEQAEEPKETEVTEQPETQETAKIPEGTENSEILETTETPEVPVAEPDS